MTLARGLTATVGVGAVLFGLLLLVTPPLAAGLTTSEAVVSIVGVTALALGGAGLVRARGAGETDALPRFPDPSRHPVAGASFDRRLRARSPAVRDRLEDATVAVLTRLRGLDAATAHERLERGDWTDDRTAAAFFAPDVVDRSRRRPTWLGGEPAVVGQARAVVGELARIVDEETGDRTTASTDGGVAAPVADDPGGPATGAERSERATEAMTTGRWTGVGPLALLTAGLAVVARRPALLLPAAIGVAMAAYAAYGRAGSPSSESLAVERRLRPATPEQGEPVEVTVTVHNEGESVLPDVRLVDGVPRELPVVEGSPRAVATLRPDEATRFSYTVSAEYGRHEFDAPLAALRDATGERRQVVRPTTEGEPLTCEPGAVVPDELPLRAETTGQVGRITADEGGSGLSFHAVREHRPGDPLSLIDWKRFARTGTLATIQFERERRTDVVLAVDCRSPAVTAPDPAARTALHRSIEAADVLATALLDGGNRVGVSAVSATPVWLAPGSGTDHEVRLRELLRTDSALTEPAADSFVRSVYLARLRRRLTEGTQVVLLSPLVDDTPVGLVRGLEAAGVPVTVLSPDPTDDATVGGLLAGVERAARVAGLRREGITVVDWSPDDRLALALARNRDLPTVVA